MIIITMTHICDQCKTCSSHSYQTDTGDQWEPALVDNWMLRADGTLLCPVCAARLDRKSLKLAANHATAGRNFETFPLWVDSIADLIPGDALICDEFEPIELRVLSISLDNHVIVQLCTNNPNAEVPAEVPAEYLMIGSKYWIEPVRK